MRRTGLVLVAALLSVSRPAWAEDFGQDGILSYWFHQYGSDDVTRPPLTPDRPYWHGDDAVPPAMRWHDRQIEVVDQYGITVGTRIAPTLSVVATEATVIPAPLPQPRLAKRRRKARIAGIARNLCPTGRH